MKRTRIKKKEAGVKTVSIKRSTISKLFNLSPEAFKLYFYLRLMSGERCFDDCVTKTYWIPYAEMIKLMTKLKIGYRNKAMYELMKNDLAAYCLDSFYE